MVPDPYNMSLSDLVEQLSQKTLLYTQLKEEHPYGPAYAECIEDIHRLQATIESRKVINMYGQQSTVNSQQSAVNSQQSSGNRQQSA